jgi:hypothetical protein
MVKIQNQVYVSSPSLLVYYDYDKWLSAKENSVDCASKIATADFVLPLFQNFNFGDRVNLYSATIEYKYPTGYSYGVDSVAKGSYVSVQTLSAFLASGGNRTGHGSPQPLPVFAFFALANCQTNFRVPESVCSGDFGCEKFYVDSHNCSSCQVIPA